MVPRAVSWWCDVGTGLLLCCEGRHFPGEAEPPDSLTSSKYFHSWQAKLWVGDFRVVETSLEVTEGSWTPPFDACVVAKWSHVLEGKGEHKKYITGKPIGEPGTKSDSLQDGAKRALTGPILLLWGGRFCKGNIRIAPVPKGLCAGEVDGESESLPLPTSSVGWPSTIVCPGNFFLSFFILGSHLCLRQSFYPSFPSQVRPLSALMLDVSFLVGLSSLTR